MPTLFTSGGADPVRVAEQIAVIAPFYAGLAYSAGAIAGAHDLLKRMFGNPRIQSENETVQTNENATGCDADEEERSAHDVN
jgi:hypothetical protein